MPDYSTIAELVDHLQGRRVSRLAVRHMRRRDIDEWTYPRIGELARRVAAGLLSDDDGVTVGESIAIIAGNRPEWIVACLGTIRAGAVATPLDVQLGDDALKRIIEDAAITHVFTSVPQFERLDQIDFGRDLRYHLLDVDDGADDDHAELSWKHLLTDAGGELPDVDPDQEAALFYTSGTTGPPKGVPLTHANLVSQISAMRAAHLVGEDDSILVPLPFHHVYPFVMGMLTPLALTATIVLPRSRTGPELVRALREAEVTRLVAVPRLYRAMYDGIRAKATRAGRLSSAYFTIASGLSTFARRRLGIRAVGKVLLRPVRRRFGPHLQLLASGGSPLDPELAWKLEGLGWRVTIGYGSTETSPLLTLLAPGDGRFDTVGKPIQGVDLRIDPSAVPRGDDGDDDETNDDGDSRAETARGRDAETGQEGEVLARGPNVFSGYRNLPEKTEEAFTDGWYRTGDLGFLDADGYLHLTGRASTLIVTESGKNVQPDGVEEAYAKHPRIREVGVLQREKQLVAIIVPETSAVRDQDDGDDSKGIAALVREAVEEQSRQLPSYQRLSDFTITNRSLPRTRLGKLRRHDLEELYESAGKQDDEAESEEAGPISIDEMSNDDRSLVRHPAAKHVWEWFADRYADRRVTPDSNPQLDLGVDSMEWLNLTLEIGERAGVELSEETIGDVESIRELLRRVVEASEEGDAELNRPLEDPDAVLSDEQRRWLDPLSGWQRVLAAVIRKTVRRLVRIYFRITVQGLDALPTDRTLVFTPNHLSHLDPFILAAALDDELLERTHWGAWTGVALRNPLSRLVSRLGRVVPIDRERAVVSSLALGSAVLSRDRNLVWFPEGERSRDGELQEFRSGIGLLLDHHRKVAVIPVRIRGTHEAMPVGGILPRPGRVQLTFGEALSPDQLEQEADGDSAHDRISRALRQRVEKLGHS